GRSQAGRQGFKGEASSLFGFDGFATHGSLLLEIGQTCGRRRPALTKVKNGSVWASWKNSPRASDERGSARGGKTRGKNEGGAKLIHQAELRPILPFPNSASIPYESTAIHVLTKPTVSTSVELIEV